MTVVRKYPTAYNNIGSWTNPAYLLGASDALCGSKLGVAYQTYDCVLSGYGFAIPAGATINSVKIGFKAAYSHIDAFVEYDYRGAGGGWSIYANVQGACAQVGWVEETIGFAVSVAELNNETFTTFVRAYFELSDIYAYVDCVYIEVDYTEAPPAKVKKPIWECKTRGGKKQERTRFHSTLKLALKKQNF